MSIPATRKPSSRYKVLGRSMQSPSAPTARPSSPPLRTTCQGGQVGHTVDASGEVGRVILLFMLVFFLLGSQSWLAICPSDNILFISQNNGLTDW